MPSGRTKISPKRGRGLGHVTLQFLAVRSAILATAWLLVCTIHPCDRQMDGRAIAYSTLSNICYMLSRANKMLCKKIDFIQLQSCCLSLATVWFNLPL